MPAAGIALGSNIEPRLQNLQNAYSWLLTLHQGSEPPLTSSIYETEPVDCPPGSSRFLNAVVEVQSNLTAHELLAKLLAYERARGRTRSSVQNSARSIDLDLLYFGEETISSPHLILPHPRLTERPFVLFPLAQIRPDLVVPGVNKSISRLAQLIDAIGIQITDKSLST